MEKRFQIFISSTYLDLQVERHEIIKTVLAMGHIPVGMEMFSASDYEQWEIIKREIDSSDYYVVVVANRYGSQTDDGISYTEKEFDYAASKGIPILGFVLDENALWSAKRSDSDSVLRTKLEKFKQKLHGKLIKFWMSKDDLAWKLSISLTKAFVDSPRTGWSRASDWPSNDDFLRSDDFGNCPELETHQEVIGFTSFSFERFNWAPVFQRNKSLKIMFMYARKWREDNEKNITTFLTDGGKLSVVLPNYANPKIIQAVGLHHESSEALITKKIKAADLAYLDYQGRFPGQVDIFYIDRMPSVALYLFNDEAIFTLQPNCPFKHSVGTLWMRQGVLYKCLEAEFDRITAEFNTRHVRKLALATPNAVPNQTDAVGERRIGAHPSPLK